MLGFTLRFLAHFDYLLIMHNVQALTNTLFSCTSCISLFIEICKCANSVRAVCELSSII